MSNSLKTILGIFSFIGFLFLPLILAYLFITFIPAMVEYENAGVEPTFQEVWPLIGGFLAIILIIGLLSFALMIFYIVHVLQDDSASSNDKILWVLLLFFFNNFVFPFYWYFRLIRKDSVDSKKSQDIGYSN